MSYLKQRKSKFKKLKEPLLIVCEDSKSSVFYLKKKVRSKGLNPEDVVVTGDCGSAPISVVNYALELKNRRKKTAKRDGTLPYSNVYCVMDVDNHPSLREAIIKARDNQMTPIVSNESFELWYLLHFVNYSTASKDRSTLNRELSAFLGKSYDKGDDCMFELLIQQNGSETNALDLSARLNNTAREDSDERDPLRNPSTEVFILINKINSYNN